MLFHYVPLMQRVHTKNNTMKKKPIVDVIAVMKL